MDCSSKIKFLKAMTDITLYHNPRCSKSRQTLKLLEEHGHTPEIVLYLENPPSPDTLSGLVKMLGVSPHDVIRTGEEPYDKGMLDWPDDKLLAKIHEAPILLQRPIVVANGAARIGRPPEAVLDIL